jgi:hypothetical protein
MGSITRTVLVLACSAALAGGMALPASAADTTTTVTVDAGLLSLTAPGTSDLGAVVPGGAAATADIVGITVADGRAGTANWTASVSLTNFVGVTPANSISATNATYDPSAVTSTTGAVSVAAGAVVANLFAGGIVQSATLVSGNNTAVWDAALAVTAPLNTLVDDYTATLTHSVL